MVNLKRWIYIKTRKSGSSFFYIKMFFDFLKAIRKQSIYAESQFLIDLNRKICTTDYKSLMTNSTRDKRIIISLTTHKDRINYVHYLLDSLFFQSLHPDEVWLYLSQGEYKQIPEVLDRFKPWLRIIETEDIGSFKKFIPALKELGGGEEYLISLDDDIMVRPDFISQLVRLKEKYPHAMIGYIGLKDKNNQTLGLAGATGILWDLKTFNIKKHPFFFKKELFIDAMGIKNNDDPWISFSAYALGVDIQYLSDDFFTTYRRDFIALPNEKMYALSAAPSDLNIVKKSLMIEKNLKRIIKNAIEAEKKS
ncbi:MULTISPECIES: glycosyltransferase family A protein [unclassified Helicobacter]|uniref:glycosyltransferase family A protein n=1 Tax=unclassified Helicobacter TaxID=2593540 RepID=UPI000CF08212|nr:MULTISPECIES: glycosyltransferase family A protein [unclassified Helicobacter]